MKFASHLALAALLGLAAAGGAAHAQVYRIVGPDGRVTFSDKPPAEGTGRTAAAPAATGGAAAGGGGAGLPFELRNVASRYPVMLYTGANCAPCTTARSYLASRGIPFSERTVTSQEDIDSLQRLSGAASLPFLTIGSQQLKGFSQIEWGQFLDAAGYPKTSQLPAGYRNPPPQPLVAVARPPAATDSQQPAPQQAEAPAPEPLAPPAPTPPGIRF